MRILIAALFLLSVVLSKAQDYPETIYTKDGYAIGGYDPVSYFLNGVAKKGDPKFSLEWLDSNWLFSSKENSEKFKAAPEKYAPQYGGYCAWGMSKGYKAKVDPENTWTVVEGKLYLNYSASIKKKWLPAKEDLIIEADKNWKKLQQ